MKAILAAILIIIVMGCATTAEYHQDRNIGPCYGSTTFGPGTYGCFYDVNQDKEPDILLVYVWNDEMGELVLYTSFTLQELMEMYQGEGI